MSDLKNIEELKVNNSENVTASINKVNDTMKKIETNLDNKFSKSTKSSYATQSSNL